MHENDPRRTKNPRSDPRLPPPREARKYQRFFLAVEAEVTDVVSGLSLSRRTTDVSRGGCFIDMLVPFDPRSRVSIRLRKNGKDLRANGIVVYSQPGLGMGVAFDQIDEQLFDAWING